VRAFGWNKKKKEEESSDHHVRKDEYE
jgi:hypothetical protein